MCTRTYKKCNGAQYQTHNSMPNYCMMHYTAKCSIAIACRLSVRLSVCDVGGSRSHRLDILETNCTDNYVTVNTFALCSPKAIHLLPGEHGETLRRLEVGWGKVVCWSTKVKIQEKLLWRTCRNSQTLFRMVPSPTPYGLLFPKTGDLQPSPKTPIAVISGMGEAKDFKFGRYIHRVHPNKSPLKILQKGGVSVSRNCPNFLGTPIISGTGEVTNFKFYTHIHSMIASIGRKAH